MSSKQPAPSTSAVPAEEGKLLATLERGPDEQLRIYWGRHAGKRCVGLRVWRKSRAGEWHPDRKKGLSLRVHELTAISDALPWIWSRYRGSALKPT